MKNSRIFLSLLLIVSNSIYAIAGTIFPFTGLDTLSRRTSLVYSSGVDANWLGGSSYFWYKNKERIGDVFYLVNGTTGDKQCTSTKDSLTYLLPADKKELAVYISGNSASTTPQPKDKSISPDGKWRAYIEDSNVYVVNQEEKEAKGIALSFDGTLGFAYHRLEWSPDSKKLAAIQTRKGNERTIPLVESAPNSQVQPILHWRRYDKPGDVIPISLPALFDITTKKQIPLDTKPYEHQFALFFTGWRDDSRAYTFEFNQRGHQQYIVGEVNAKTGDIRALVDEQLPTFIDYRKKYRYDLEDGKEILWVSERDGWRHLYRIDGQTGEVKNRITAGEWVVREVLHIDEGTQTVFFTASGLYSKEDPYNIHYCKIGFDGRKFKDLTPENANHTFSFSKDRTRFVDTYSRPDLPPISVLREGSTGKIITTLEECDVSDLLAIGWSMPEVFHAKGRDGKTDIWGTIFRPANYDPTKSYPIIEDIYAGPHDSFVNKNFSAFEYYNTPLTELGFIVVKIDGMGTNNRSKSFHDVCWKNLKDAGFPDRIQWIKAAAKKYPYMDTSRVGVYGWSAGGQSAMGALLFFNDFYDAAVSFCGCHDNRVDKIWWNEQWMGYPVDESYSKSSNVDNAHLLQGDLLLINGELDDNVDPASTLQVVKALMKANKYFEQLYLPGRNHSLGEQFEVYRMYDFFVRNLRDK